jgi:hypothetical protein
MAKTTVPGAEGRLGTLRNGAAELQSLLRQLKAKTDADLGAYYASHPDRGGEDGRDYRGLADMVATAIEGNLHHPDPAYREGFLRALTDLLVMEAEGVGPSDDWDPIANTARSFDADRPILVGFSDIHPQQFIIKMADRRTYLWPADAAPPPGMSSDALSRIEAQRHAWASPAIDPTTLVWYVARQANGKLISGSRLSEFFQGEGGNSRASDACGVLRKQHPDAGMFHANSIEGAEHYLSGASHPFPHQTDKAHAHG